MKNIADSIPSITAQKMKFSIKDFFSKCDQCDQFPEDLVRWSYFTFPCISTWLLLIICTLKFLEVQSYDLHFLAKFRNLCCLQDKFYLKLLDIVILLQSCPVLQKTYSNLFQIIFHKIKLDYLFNFHPF